jgi:hypothetical protein
MLFGFMVKLNEAAKGNFESLRGMSLESVLDVRNSPHSQLSTCQEQLCENDTKNQGSTRDADESTIANEVVNRQSKKRAAMPPANNHGKNVEVVEHDNNGFDSAKRLLLVVLGEGPAGKGNEMPIRREIQRNIGR